MNKEKGRQGWKQHCILYLHLQMIHKQQTETRQCILLLSVRSLQPPGLQVQIPCPIPLQRRMSYH